MFSYKKLYNNFVSVMPPEELDRHKLIFKWPGAFILIQLVCISSVVVSRSIQLLLSFKHWSIKDPAALGLILGNAKKLFNVAEIYQWRRIVEIGQRFINADQTKNNYTDIDFFIHFIFKFDFNLTRIFYSFKLKKTS